MFNKTLVSLEAKQKPVDHYICSKFRTRIAVRFPLQFNRAHPTVPRAFTGKTRRRIPVIGRIALCAPIVRAYSRMSLSWACAAFGWGCLMRSRQWRISMTIMPISITQTTRPTMIKMSCQSTGINAKQQSFFNDKQRNQSKNTEKRVLYKFLHYIVSDGCM